MNTLRECPECDKPLGRKRTCICGWKVPPDTTTRHAASADAGVNMPGCCEWQGDGSRCHFAGSMSLSTRGDGPWYCAAHFGLDDPVLGVAIVDESHKARPQPDYRFAARRERVRIEAGLAAGAEHSGKLTDAQRAQVAHAVLNMTSRARAMPARPIPQPQRRLPTLEELREADAERRALQVEGV